MSVMLHGCVVPSSAAPRYYLRTKLPWYTLWKSKVFKAGWTQAMLLCGVLPGSRAVLSARQALTGPAGTADPLSPRLHPELLKIKWSQRIFLLLVSTFRGTNDPLNTAGKSTKIICRLSLHSPKVKIYRVSLHLSCKISSRSLAQRNQTSRPYLKTKSDLSISAPQRDLLRIPPFPTTAHWL